ncbi:MAG: radical SAM protein [Myxococcaceae bacterium]
MLAARPHIEPRAVPSADSVVVSEVYLSLQGESSHAGLLCAFVRLTGCHLRCTYCDSAFAFYGGKRRKIRDVIEEVKAMNVARVEVTGGEPLLQPGVYPLMQGLLDAGLTVLLETSGAIDVRLVPVAVHKIVDLKTPSSGECDRNDFRVLDSMNHNDELKFVLGTQADYDWALRLIRERKLGERPFGILFSTVFGGALSPRQAADQMIRDRVPGRFQLQLHKYLWEPTARGV